MKREIETTLVVKIRMSESDKKRVTEIADYEGRTFASQCRLFIRDGVENYTKENK